MAVENLVSTIAANASTQDGFSYGVGGYYRDTIATLQTTTTNTSTYRVHSLPSTAIPKFITVRTGGSGDSPDTDVGLYHVQTATAYDGVLATALDLDDTGDHIALNLTYGGTYKTAQPKTLWELAGLTQDPGGNFNILLSLDADNVATGTHEVIVETLRIA
jgi:hypothetical protein